MTNSWQSSKETLRNAKTQANTCVRKWPVISVFVILQSILLSLMMLAIMMYEAQSSHDNILFRDFALILPIDPKAEITWQDEVEQFANKLSEAYNLNHKTATEFSPWLLEAAERQQVTPELLASLIYTESSFRKYVSSHVGAVGPAQVRPVFWESYCGSKELSSNPAENIYCGAQVLAYFREVCEQDMKCALQSYNVGFTSFKKGAYIQARKRYLAKVNKHLKLFKEETSIL